MYIFCYKFENMKYFLFLVFFMKYYIYPDDCDIYIYIYVYVYVKVYSKIKDRVRYYIR